MAYANNKITAPVSIYDVQRAISQGSTDLGTLCKSENLNKWAKFKPLKVAQLNPLTLSARAAATVNHGIKNIPTWSYLSRMATFLFSDNRGGLPSTDYPSCGYSASTTYWDYEKPAGTSQSPYRLTDFSEYPVPSSSPKGYYHLAEAPIGNMESLAIQISPEGVLQIKFPLGTSDPCTLTLADLTLPDAGSTQVGNMYFGVLLKQTSGSITNRTYVITQSTTMSQLSASYAVIEIPLTASDTNWVGTWKIFPIISSVAISTLSTSISDYNGNYFVAPLPYHSDGIEISIEYAEVTIINANGYRDMSSQQRYVRIPVSLKNSGSELRAYRVNVTLIDKNGNTTTYTGTQTGTLAAGGTASLTISIYVAQDWNLFQNGYFTAECVINSSVDQAIFKNTSTWPQTQLTDQTPTP